MRCAFFVCSFSNHTCVGGVLCCDIVLSSFVINSLRKRAGCFALILVLMYFGCVFVRSLMVTFTNLS